MRRLFLFGSILPTLLLTACTPMYSSSDGLTQAFREHHVARLSLDWPGSYVGMFPCADCSGIRTTLSLQENGSYILTRQYADDHEATINHESGNFQWINKPTYYRDKSGRFRQMPGGASIVLLHNGKTDGWFRVEENALEFLGPRVIWTPNDPDAPGPRSSLYAFYFLQKVANESSAQNLFASFRWQAAELLGDVVTNSPQGKTPFLEFLPKSQRVAGWDGCNRFTGDYAIGKDDALQFQKIATTRMACMDTSIDSHFQTVLEKTRAFKVEGENGLELLGDHGQVIGKFVANSQLETH